MGWLCRNVAFFRHDVAVFKLTLARAWRILIIYFKVCTQSIRGKRVGYFIFSASILSIVSCVALFCCCYCNMPHISSPSTLFPIMCWIQKAGIAPQVNTQKLQKIFLKWNKVIIDLFNFFFFYIFLSRTTQTGVNSAILMYKTTLDANMTSHQALLLRSRTYAPTHHTLQGGILITMSVEIKTCCRGRG